MRITSDCSAIFQRLMMVNSHQVKMKDDVKTSEQLTPRKWGCFSGIPGRDCDRKPTPLFQCFLNVSRHRQSTVMSMSSSPRFRGLVALLHPRPFPVRGFASPHLSPSPARLTSRTPLSSIATSTSPSTSPSHRRHFTPTPTTMAATEATLRKFFQSPQYAVVGASTNTQKYGFKGEYPPPPAPF